MLSECQCWCCTHLYIIAPSPTPPSNIGTVIGAVVGVLGAVCLVVVVVIIIMCVLRRGKAVKHKEDDVEMSGLQVRHTHFCY